LDYDVAGCEFLRTAGRRFTEGSICAIVCLFAIIFILLVNMLSSTEVLEMTLPCVQRDFAEWRQGRIFYAVWALDLDTPELRARSESLRARFAKYFLPDYCRQPHVTIDLCGFPAPEAVLKDDYGFSAFADQLAHLGASQLAPFTIEVGQPDSFSSAAYFSLADTDGGIERLRGALGTTRPANDFSYVPHVTFGLHRRAVPLGRMVQELQAADGIENLSVEISKLSLMIYQASVIGGPLSTLAEFDLRCGDLEMREPLRMDELFGEVWRKSVFP
jgi:hypothetical protein